MLFFGWRRVVESIEVSLAANSQTVSAILTLGKSPLSWLASYKHDSIFEAETLLVLHESWNYGNIGLARLTTHFQSQDQHSTEFIDDYKFKKNQTRVDNPEKAWQIPVLCPG